MKIITQVAVGLSQQVNNNEAAESLISCLRRWQSMYTRKMLINIPATETVTLAGSHKASICAAKAHTSSP